MRLTKLHKGFSMLILLSIVIVVVFLTLVFTGLSTIHSEGLPEDYFSAVPAILPLLNAEWFMAFVFIATIATVIGVLFLLWRLHEVPVQQAERENQLLTKLIFGLALCGLFLHKAWWVVAIILAFTPWQDIGQRIALLFRQDGEKQTPASEVDEQEANEQQP